MPCFLVATRLQVLCGKPYQLAKILRVGGVDEAQIPGTKNALWRAFLDTLVLVQDRFWGNVVSYFACDIPQYLSGS